MRVLALVLIAALFIPASAVFAQETNDWRKVADSIPLGSKVKVHTLGGQRISGTLMRVDDTAVMVKTNTRVPEPAVTITFDRVSSIERSHSGGFGWGKAVGIGLGAGAGAILTMFVIALQID